MDRVQELSKEIGELNQRYTELEATLQSAETVDQYDAIIKELWDLDAEIERLRARREIERWSNAPAQE